MIPSLEGGHNNRSYTYRSSASRTARGSSAAFFTFSFFFIMYVRSCSCICPCLYIEPKACNIEEGLMQRVALEAVSLVRSVAARSVGVYAPTSCVRRRVGRCSKLFTPPLVPRMPPMRAMSASATDSREYPPVPRVGVGVVVLRTNESTNNAEVLLIQRGKEPGKGQWTFPGGGLELGETIVECAEREVFEETGVIIKSGSGTENLMGCGVIPQLR